MNRTLSKLALATSLTFAAAAANAGDNFVGLTWGQTDNNIQKSSALNSNLNSPKLDKVLSESTASFERHCSSWLGVGLGGIPGCVFCFLLFMLTK